jgi:hypothetical protein
MIKDFIHILYLTKVACTEYVKTFFEKKMKNKKKEIMIILCCFDFKSLAFLFFAS